MQSYVLDSEKWGYVCVSIGMLLCVWFILDYFFVYKSQYSIHRIFRLNDNIYKIVCVIFFTLALSGTIYFYMTFSRIAIFDTDTIGVYYLFPRPPQFLLKKEIKSYLIKTPKEEKNRILYIHLKNSKRYRSVPVGPEYHTQLYSLTDTLDKIIQENQSPR